MPNNTYEVHLTYKDGHRESYNIEALNLLYVFVKLDEHLRGLAYRHNISPSEVAHLTITEKPTIEIDETPSSETSLDDHDS